MLLISLNISVTMIYFLFEFSLVSPVKRNYILNIISNGNIDSPYSDL